jgi:hypothetical protein
MFQSIIVETPAIVIGEMLPASPDTIPVCVYDPLIYHPINSAHVSAPSLPSSAIVTPPSMRKIRNGLNSLINSLKKMTMQAIAAITTISLYDPI